MSADIIDLRPILAREIGSQDHTFSAKRLADRVFAGALAQIDAAYGREYRRLVLLKTLYAMEHADESCRSSSGGD